MSDLQMWSLLVGILAPPVYAVIQQPRWKPPVRAGMTVVLVLFTATGTAYFQHDFTGKGIVSSALLVFVAAVSSYIGFWKKTGIAPAIERTTSGQPTTPAATPEARGDA